MRNIYILISCSYDNVIPPKSNQIIFTNIEKAEKAKDRLANNFQNNKREYPKVYLQQKQYFCIVQLILYTDTSCFVFAKNKCKFVIYNEFGKIVTDREEKDKVFNDFCINNYLY